MVTFTCNECGDSVKKNQVDKHSFRCRFQTITCIDCSKDFSRSSYHSHNKCITEDEKYGGKDWKPKKGGQDKNQVKQDQWLQNIESAIQSGKAGDASRWMKDLMNYPNVPRKQRKFENFVRNCMKMRDQKLIDKMWSVIQEANKNNEATGTSPEKPAVEEVPVPAPDPVEVSQIDTNGDAEPAVSKKKKKRKHKNADLEAVDEPVVDAPQPESGEVNDQNEAKKKKKKHKKPDDGPTENQELNGVPPVEAMEAPETVDEVIKKKKKKHKRKHADVPVEDMNANQTLGQQEEPNDGQVGHKKKKLKHKKEVVA